jgi:hypothetical protein
MSPETEGPETSMLTYMVSFFFVHGRVNTKYFVEKCRNKGEFSKEKKEEKKKDFYFGIGIQ